MLVIDVVHRLHSWVGYDNLPLLEACLVPFGNIKTSPQGGAVQDSFSSGDSGPFFPLKFKLS